VTKVISGGNYDFAGPWYTLNTVTHFYVTNYFGNSITEFAWDIGEWQGTFTAPGYQFNHPGEMWLGGKSGAWVAWVDNLGDSHGNGSSLTEISVQ
jgi:hypothetical protein